mmetsp:Transcript_74020/g.131003  ORF Transcript_74020/g.131003 Transcript_74020/m.131003 type:complete len:234 (-) Transcript_74020:89-790(-)
MLDQQRATILDQAPPEQVLPEQTTLPVQDATARKVLETPNSNLLQHNTSDPVLESELPRKLRSDVSIGSIAAAISKWRTTAMAEIQDFGHKSFPENPPSSIGKQAAAPQGLEHVSSDTSPTVEEVPALPSGTMSGGIKATMPASAKMRSFINSQAQLDSVEACSAQELMLASELNSLMMQESKDAELVVTNLPDMPPGESAYGYFELIEEMTRNFQRCFLVRGTGSEVITSFT